MPDLTNDRERNEPPDAELLDAAKRIQAVEWTRHGRRLGLNVCVKLAREERSGIAAQSRS